MTYDHFDNRFRRDEFHSPPLLSDVIGIQKRLDLTNHLDRVFQKYEKLGHLTWHLFNLNFLFYDIS